MRCLTKVKDFIVVRDLCEFCSRIKLAWALALDSDIDLIDVNSGDPRKKMIENLYGTENIYVPTGIVKNTILHSSRDVFSMLKFFGGGDD